VGAKYLECLQQFKHACIISEEVGITRNHDTNSACETSSVAAGRFDDGKIEKAIEWKVRFSKERETHTHTPEHVSVKRYNNAGRLEFL